MDSELKLNQARQKVGADQERLMTIASEVQKQSEIDALNIAMAQQRIQDEEFKADTQYRAAEGRIRSTEISFKRKPKTPAT